MCHSLCAHIDAHINVASAEGMPRFRVVILRKKLMCKTNKGVREETWTCVDRVLTLSSLFYALPSS